MLFRSHYLDIYRKDLGVSGRDLILDRAKKDILRFAGRLKETGSVDYWFAILGILAGFCDQTLKGTEKDYRFEVADSPVARIEDAFKTPEDVLRVCTLENLDIDQIIGIPCHGVEDLIRVIQGGR